MCGICGIINWEAAIEADASVLKNMIWTMRHRGPDEFGLFLDGPAALGHARLSIIDLAGGAQPMANEDETLWITFNGEIFNYIELRKRLEVSGHTFRTHSDTEVILHLFEDYGTACLDQLNGQFAFAIWDRSNRHVFMARDRFGIRPLYYVQEPGRFLFASEIKALLAVPGIKAELDPIGLDQVFTFWATLPPRTAFQGVSQLPAGHYLTASPSGLRIQQYWDLEFRPEAEYADEVSDDALAQRLLEELTAATRLQMRADVPVGAYVSGGLDSSLTAAIIKRATDAPLDTFSVTFQDEVYNEGPHQRAAADHLGTNHHATQVTKQDIARSFSDVMWHAETPILRTAPAPLHRLSELVRDTGIKVVVTGEGADELFAGYNIFKEAKIRRFWARHPHSRLRPLLLQRVYPYIQRPEGHLGHASWQRFFATGLTDTERLTYSHLIRWNNTAALKSLFTADLRNQIAGYDPIHDFESTLPDGFARWAPLSQAQYIEMTTFMTNYLLSSQGDRVAMAHAVEARYPFLDHHVAEFAATIPASRRMRVLDEKYMLRLAARGLVPEHLRLRGKQPYRAPDSASFFCPEMREFTCDILSRDNLRLAGCFEPAMVARLVEKRPHTPDADVNTRTDMAITGIISTQLLYRQFVATPPLHAIPSEITFRIRRPAAGQSRTMPATYHEGHSC